MNKFSVYLYKFSYVSKQMFILKNKMFIPNQKKVQGIKGCGKRSKNEKVNLPKKKGGKGKRKCVC
jgi:hypothetical protein